MSEMRKTKKSIDLKRAKILKEIEADIAKALKEFDELNEEVDLEDGTWMPLDPDAVFDEIDEKEVI